MHDVHQPTTPATFWEERIGWSALKQFLLLEPLPGGARWTAAFGSLLLFSFALQVVTGILLATNYAPSVETAWPSVRFIQEDVQLGAFVRAVHHWGSSAMVVLLLVHIIQVFVWGAYKRPRELTWMVGVLLLVCTLGLAFTGYLLPWDQKAYWATKVGLGIASTVPWIGDGLRTLLQGGPEMGNLTLTRFFSVHVFILPGLLILLAVVHLYLFRRHGVTPSWWYSEAELRRRAEPFWPKQALMDGVVALLFLAGLGVWCYYRPAPLEAQADPSQAYEARPEWYFMFLFQLLRYFEGPYEIVGTFVLPALFFLVLFFWPLLDRNPVRDPRRRPIAIGLLTLGSAGLVGMTIYANATDVRMKEPELAKAKAPAPAAAAGPLQRVDVARLYNANCAGCHGVDGTGSVVRAAIRPTIPDFTSLAWQMSQTDLEITHRIMDGSGQLMPAYREQLGPQQVLALAIYVRYFSGAPVEPAPPRPATATTPATPPPSTPATQPATAFMPPAQVYRTYCMACHDTDGDGKIARKAMPDLPYFTHPDWQKSRTDKELVHSILEGKTSPGKPMLMMPMKDKLSPADAERMVAYVRAFQGGKQVTRVEAPKPRPAPPPQPRVAVTTPRRAPGARRPAPAPSAEEIARLQAAAGLYRQYCLVCHGAEGRGLQMRPSMPAIPDFTGRTWQEEATAPRLAASILNGKGTLMPAFSGRVGDDQAQDLAAYVRAFGPVRSAAKPAAGASDFEKRFHELEEQWDELEKQLKELTPQPGKPKPSP
jgi:ubiquinol-cytochrome c reductase cytochrome b subunit